MDQAVRNTAGERLISRLRDNRDLVLDTVDRITELETLLFNIYVVLGQIVNNIDNCNYGCAKTKTTEIAYNIAEEITTNKPWHLTDDGTKTN